MNIILILKKIALIFFASIILFSASIAFPLTQQKAMANPLAVPAGVTIGAGAYTIGAMGLAGLVGLAGYEEYEEEINAHAMRAWENGTQIAKDSINVSLDAAAGLGNGLVRLEEPFLDYTENLIGQISTFATNLYLKKSISQQMENFTFRPSNTSSFTATIYPVQGYAWVANGVPIKATTLDLSTNRGLAVVGNHAITNELVTVSRGAMPLNAEYYALKDLLYSQGVRSDLEKIMAIYASYGVSLSLIEVSTELPIYQQGLSKTREAWTSMRDAGLVLPVDSAIPHAMGKPATYNADAGTYTGIDGGILNPADVTWSFPVPRIRTDNVPVPGVYVDTPVITGVPAIDETIVGNPAIPKTTTNVNTGVTVGNPDYVGEGNPPIEGEVPPPTNPPPSKWEKPPTKKPPNIGALITTKFPFSLPFDFFGVLGWLNAEPKAPVFKIDTGIKSPLSEKEVKLDMEFKFNFLDPYMGFFRSFIIIGFSLFLILATRKLLGGAG